MPDPDGSFWESPWRFLPAPLPRGPVIPGGSVLPRTGYHPACRSIIVHAAMIRRLLLAAAAVLLAPLGAEAGLLELGAAGGEERNGPEVVLPAPGSVSVAAWNGAGSPETAEAGPVAPESWALHRGWIASAVLVETVSSGVLHRLRLLRAGHGARKLDLPPPSHD
jgi:hypothetical protein